MTPSFSRLRSPAWCLSSQDYIAAMSYKQEQQSEEEDEERGIEYVQALRTDGPENTANASLRQYLEEDEQSRYFMSEPSLSTDGDRTGADDSCNRSYLLSPRDSSSEDSAQLLKASYPPPPPAQQPPWMSSPGNTSLSSRDSPYPQRKVQLQFTHDKRSLLKFGSTPSGPVLMARPNPIRLEKITGAEEFDSKKDASDQLAQSSRSTSSASLGQQQRVAEFLQDLKLQSIGKLEDAGLNDIDSIPVAAADRREIDAVMRRQEDLEDVAGDETIIFTLSDSDSEKEDEFDPLDWEHQHSADDEQTFERPRSVRRLLAGSSKTAASKTAPGHRRTRSGDDVAATLMTGSVDWKGMQEDNLHRPQSPDDDDEEHDEQKDAISPIRKTNSGAALSRPRNKQARVPSTGEPISDVAPVFIIGVSGTGVPQASRKARKPPRQRRGMERVDPWNTSIPGSGGDLSSPRSLSSPRVQPFSAIGDAPPSHHRASLSEGSFPTMEQFGTLSPQVVKSTRGVDNARFMQHMHASFPGNNPSDSSHDSFQGRRSWTGDVPRAPLEFVERPDYGQQFSDSSFATMQSRGSQFSWVSSNRASGPIAMDPPPEQELIEEELAGVKAVHFEGEVDDDGEFDERHISANQLRNSFLDPDNMGSTERLFEDRAFRGKAQNVLRPHHPRVEAPKSFPTFVCPQCGTIQRSFFTASTAPIQFEGPSSYLALYFALYVVASLYIFGLEEGWNGIDCVYFAVITLTTAGLGDLVPTSDTAKIICSIFIYFGVACIGLLLGTYLAGMLDESSLKEAMKSRVDNCVVCSRVKTAQKRQKKQHVASRQSTRQAHHAEYPMKFGNFSMSERSTCSTDAHHQTHQSGFEHNQKRRKQQHGDSKQPDSISSRGSVFSDSSSSAHSLSPVVAADQQRKGVSSPNPAPGLHVINGYGAPPSPRAPAAKFPSNVIGSPMTTQILGRQKHTRHHSFDVTNSNFSGPPPFTGSRRSRNFSADVTHPGTIPEAHTFHGSSTRASNPASNDNLQEDEHAQYDEDAAVSIDSEVSEIDNPDSRQSKIKTAKYVFLTLKQALMNSVVIISIGSVGFYLIEKMTVVDSFYFTTVLLTTVGYGDITPVTNGGKLFATLYVLVAGTVLLHNMSLISMIPLELRKRRIEKAVLTQFGDQLDDAALQELATGPLIDRLQLSANSANGLNECTREMFSLAMLVRLGKVTERDVRQTFAAFHRLDVDSEGVLNSKTIITGMMKKCRSQKDLSSADPFSPSASSPPPPPPAPEHLEHDNGSLSNRYLFRTNDGGSFRFGEVRRDSLEKGRQGEQTALLDGQNMNGHSLNGGTFSPQNHDEEQGFNFF